LGPVLQQALRGKPDREVFLEADQKVPYGRVVQVMAAVKRAGVEKLGMVTRFPEE
ncbi:MAG: biopolymer transporter ExbD, partial [Desulfuromonadales bacterium]|nr:biopolymer transporter ExbD [Desulfuromonadales bacterium]